MAAYGPVPSNENESERQQSLTESTSKQAAQVYTQVPSDDGVKPRQIGNHIRDICVNPLLLLGLAFFFAGSALTIGILYHFSRVNNGLTTETSSHRYAWLYGPTAVVVLTRVIWRVIDLKTKETTPWQELATGPSPAKKTILLDYLSPSTFPSVWKSLKNRHWAVTTTIAGQLLLLLSTVFITGLFTLETTVISEDNVPFRSTHFNGSALDVNKISASSALLSLAIQTQNLSYPRGTTIDTVVPLFESESALPNNSITQALVKGLKVSVDCEALDIQNATTMYLPWYSIRAPSFLINVTTPSCNIMNARIGMGPNHGYVQDRNATQTYQGWMDNYACNTGLDYSQPWGDTSFGIPRWSNDTTYLKSLNRTLDDRIIVSVVDFHYVPGRAIADIPYMWVNKLTALLCKPSYSINEYRVDYSGNTTSSNIEFVQGTNDTLKDFYPGDISKSIRQVFSDYPSLFIGLGGVDYQFSSTGIQPFIQMLELLHGGELTNFTLKDLTDSEVLKASAQAMITGTMTQVLRQHAMSNTSDTTLTGTASYRKDRLHVQSLSTGFLCATFGVMFILCIALLFVVPQKSGISGAVASTLSVAVALQSNPDVVHKFLSTTPQDLDSSSGSSEFFTRRHAESDKLVIDFVPAPGTTDVQSSKDSELSTDGMLHEWWYPATGRWWYTIAAVAICVIVIILLEVIQQISDKRSGFIGIKSIGFGSTVLSQYVPAAVVLGITLMFADIEMMAATFSPFVTLKRGQATASRSLALDYLTRSGPHVFVGSIINRHFALSVILMSTLIASFLAIIIPSLYSGHANPYTTNETLIRVDQFNFSGVDISLDDKRAGTILNLLTYYDIGYPKWIYDDLAIPQVRTGAARLGKRSNASNSASTLSTRTKAFRAKLSCQSISAQMNWTAKRNSTSVSAKTYLPWSMCSNPPANATRANSTTPWAQWDFTVNNTLPTRNSYFVGSANILLWSLNSVNVIQYISEADPTLFSQPSQYALPEWGCPSLTFSFGSLSFKTETHNSNTTWTLEETDINTLVCSQNLQSVDTDITLEHPSMAILNTLPPRPDESTAKWIQNPADESGGTGFQFVVNNMFISLNNPDGFQSAPWAISDVADRFTQAVIHTAQKEAGLGLSDLSGVSKSDTYVKMVQKLYGRYMAQAMSNNMRVSIDENEAELAVTSAVWTATASPVIHPMPSSSSVSKPKSSVNATATIASKLSTNATVSAGQTRASISTTMISPTIKPNQLQKRANNATPTLSATMTHTGPDAHIRLKQNRSPKIALQIMLACMAVGAIVTRLLLKPSETLQREPYSIAGRAVLVANGDLLETRVDGDRVGGKGGGRMYRLGWMEDGKGKRRYGVCVER